MPRELVPSRSWILGLSALSLTIWNSVAQASEGAKAAPAPTPELVALEPMQVPVIDHGALVGRLEVRAMWKVAAGGKESAARQSLPALRAALLAAATDHARLTATPGQPVDPSALAERLATDASKQGFSGELLVLEAVTRSC